MLKKVANPLRVRRVTRFLTVNVLAGGLWDTSLDDTTNNALNSTVSDLVTANDTTLGDGRHLFPASLLGTNAGNEHAVWFAFELAGRRSRTGWSVTDAGCVDSVQVRVIEDYFFVEYNDQVKNTVLKCIPLERQSGSMPKYAGCPAVLRTVTEVRSQGSPIAVVVPPLRFSSPRFA